MPDSLAKTLDALLPQTQCGACGYPGCLPYAEALAEQQTTIDRCPPGGITTLRALANVLAIDPTPYEAVVKANTRPPNIVNIRETECIGCTKCIPACPVDAIIGSAKQLHQVLPDECTGCGLCIEPCPVDCIEIVEMIETVYDKNLARKRFEAKNIRKLREAQSKEKQYQAKRREIQNQTRTETQKASAKHDYILAAIERVKNKR